MLIAQDRAEAEVATRDGGVWRSSYLRDSGANLRLEELGLELGLGGALAGVELVAGPAAGAGGV